MGFMALPVLAKSFETLAVCQWCVKQNATIGKEMRHYKQHNVDGVFKPVSPGLDCKF